MATPPLSEKEIARRIAAIKQAVKSGYRRPGVPGKGPAAISIAAKALGLSREAMTSFVLREEDTVQAAISKIPEREKLTAAIETASLAATRRSQQTEADLRQSLKLSLNEITALHDRIKALEWSSQVSYRPAEWSYQAKAGSKKTQHIPYLLASDFQVGEVIAAAEVGGNAYNIDIFRSRYRKTISTAIKLATEHVGPTWSYPGIIYARGGDAISGAIHDELAMTDEMSPFDCVLTCVEEEATGILELAKAFGKVDVKSVFGNHGRIDKKPPHKQFARRNYEYLGTKMLVDKFKGDRRISFQSTESPDVYYPIYNQSICLTHGDRIGSRGGQGFVGPVATIARGCQKVINQGAAMGQRIDAVHLGHFHTSLLSSFYMVNGSLPGYSEFAFSNRMRPEPPQQTLAFYSERHGLVDYRLIRLD